MSYPPESLTADLVNGIQQGSQSSNVAAAVGVATGYGILMFLALFNFWRERHASHIILAIFGASEALTLAR